MNLKKFFCYTFLFFSFTNAFASPPYVNGDPDTGEKYVTETYLLYVVSYLPHSSLMAGILQIEPGIADNWQLHLAIPVLYNRNVSTPSSVGISDTEFSIKWRFLQAHNYWPDLAVEPTFEFPTGNVERNLGNGRMWYKLPLWFGKQWGKWLLQGGGGYVFNAAPGTQNFNFFGATLQYEMTDALWLGAELYNQGNAAQRFLAPNQDLGAFTLANVGVTYQVYKRLALLGLIGHSIGGIQQWYGTAGIDVTIG